MTFRHLQSLPAFNRHFVMVLTVLILVLAAALVYTVINPSQGRQVWRIAVTDWPGFDPLHLAEEKGFFDQNGLDIQLIPINSIIDMRTAFERNLIDGYTAPLVDVVESMQNTGVPANIVLALDYSNGGDLILAVPAIPHPWAFGDARVGVETSSALGRYLLARALQGKTPENTSLRLVQGNQPRLAELAIAGKLDAVVTYHPYSERIQKLRNMHVIYSSADIPLEIMDVLAISNQMRAQDPAIGIKLQKVWQQALDYATQHPSETTAIHARRYGTTPEAYLDMTRDIQQIDSRSMQDLVTSGQIARVFRQAAQALTPSIPLPASRISHSLAITLGGTQ